MTTYNTRIQLKSDSETNWLKVASTFKPLLGEMIIYLPDSTHSYSRIKIGDGSNFLQNLDFIDAGTINGKEIEIVQLASYQDKPQIGSPDKLYLDCSTNSLYYFNSTANQYYQLSHFTLKLTTAPFTYVKDFNQGTLTTASIDDNTLIIINGALPSISKESSYAVTNVQYNT